MSTKQTIKTTLQWLGLGIFGCALLLFTLLPGLAYYELSESALLSVVQKTGQAEVIQSYRGTAFAEAAAETGLTAGPHPGSFAFSRTLKKTYQLAQEKLDARISKDGIPDGVNEWDVRLGDYTYFKGDVFDLSRLAEKGPVKVRPLLFFGLTIGLGILGGLLYILPKFGALPGIKHDHIYHDALTRGLRLGWRGIFLALSIVATLVYGYYYMAGQWFWPMITLGITLAVIALVLFTQKGMKNHAARSAGPAFFSGWLGIIAGTYLIGFYVLLYWAPQHISPWITMVNPVKEAVFGSAADQWFLYGLLYTIIILVMGVRMFSKYQHNKYQQFRTASVMFFQLAFAFLIPEILASLSLPAQDLKNIWPLDYDFFFSWQLDQFRSAGAVGLFMLFWGVVLVIVGVPLMVHLLGKRWYCSWVCGCGGLAETMGDPWRQLSDKSLRAWRFERWIIHGVLLAAILMTALTLYSYFSGQGQLLGFETWRVQRWYGFLIGAGFAGVVGTGFYPLMGNRVWCRFGCPLAAYLGLVQRFQSRFRITTNGSQCISCGNCSTYCEMGIDVRHYAQRGQDIVRSSCVGCGVCAAVCPRGVLRLENASGDIGQRGEQLRSIHISEEEVRLLD